MTSWDFETRSVHAGRNQGPLQDPSEPRPEGMGTPVAPGIQPSSAYYFDSLDALDRAFDDPARGFVYARHGGQTGASAADDSCFFRLGDTLLEGRRTSGRRT